MSRKQILVIFSIISFLAFLSFYITQHKDNNDLVREPLKASDILAKEEINKEENLSSNEKTTDLPDDQKLEKDGKDMSPSEYVAWLKDGHNRVLLEVKPDGTKIYRKGNVTITVMRNGEELYLPDEI